MAEYVCIRDCYHRKRRYYPGDSYMAADGEEVPRHFASKGTPIPEPDTPRLGARVQGAGKPLPSLRSPGKAEFEEKDGNIRPDTGKANKPKKVI